MADLIAAVKELRERLGDTQQAFAARLGLSISAITNYERTREATGKSLAQLMKAADANGHQDLARVFQDALSAELGYSIPRLGTRKSFEAEPGEERYFAALTAALRMPAYATVRAKLEEDLRPVIEANEASDFRVVRDLGLFREAERRVALGESDAQIEDALGLGAGSAKAIRESMSKEIK